MKELIPNKIYYKIFDKSFKESTHIYNKKNKSNDSAYLQMVQNNRMAIINHCQATDIVILQQIHSNKIIDADYLANNKLDLEADGAVTIKKNLVLTVQTADCVPILLSSNDGEVIGVAHCGWRGSKAGIVNNLIELMSAKGAKNIKAIIGPSIQQSSYQVDQNYYDDFVKYRADFSKFFIKSTQKDFYMFNLPACVELYLQDSGVENIINLYEDTYANLNYPSYRRAFHMGESHLSFERILSTIMIKP